MLKEIRMKDIRNLAWGYHYKIIKTHVKGEITITHPIPIHTGCTYSGTFPKYLAGFEDYYEKKDWHWYLKSEYHAVRPQYTITLPNKLYDVELTSRGKEGVMKRYNYHKRLMEEYKKLMEKDEE